MRFTLKIELGNDAMSTSWDVADALHAVARRMQNEYAPDQVADGAGGLIRDMNGNTVGEWEYVRGETD